MTDSPKKNKGGMDQETSKKNEGGMTMTFQCPILDSTNYTIWAVKIKALFNVYGLWEALEPKGDLDAKKNTTAIAYLFQALPEQLVLQVAHHTNAADIWEDLKARFVGADRVKEARLQTLESEFENLKMKDSETLDEFTGKISQLVSQANNLGSTIENKRLVRKLLGSAPAKFMQIVAAIEQFADLNTMSFQEAVGRLKAYEERIKKPNKEEDAHNGLLYAKVDEKEEGKERSCARCGYKNSSQDNKGRGRGSKWNSWKNKDGNQLRQDKSHIKCFKCNEFGHFKHECTKKEDEVNLARYEDDEPTVGATLL